MNALDARILVNAYAQGVFPMAGPGGELRWYSPDPRGILPLDEFHLPHTLRRRLRQVEWRFTFDRNFERVMEYCAEREETWIDARIHSAYTDLHGRGLAHSVEIWDDSRMVGGLYGVSLGGAFFGESMFHRVTDASKAALFVLVETMRAAGYGLLDIQWTTPHLCQFGARAIEREQYLHLLERALNRQRRFQHSSYPENEGLVCDLYKSSRRC